MPWRSPAGPLIHEHQLIKRVLAVLQSQLDPLSQGRVDPTMIDGEVDFLRKYADRCHHGKEEEILFRRLAEKRPDATLATLMEELIQEHAQVRESTRRLEEAHRRYAAGEHDAVRTIELSYRELIELYPRHTEKEERRFFKPSLEYFTDTERVQMLRDFDTFDRDVMHEKYGAVVDALELESGKTAAMTT